MNKRDKFEKEEYDKLFQAALNRSKRDRQKRSGHKIITVIAIGFAIFIPVYFLDWVGFCIGFPLSIGLLIVAIKTEPVVKSSYTPEGDY